ncbi:MAG: response regulator [Desulfarculus sp.]|nr:MAG: response regulator [Desulfarculus sp.]
MPAGPAPAAPEPARPPAGRPAPGGQETILVVDDEDALRELSQRLLASAGYTVLTAGSGEEALEQYRARQKDISLVILDLNMPGMGGLKCLQGILAQDAGAKVLISSGYAAGGLAKAALAAGAAGFVAKPYRGTDLLAEVRQRLDQEGTPPA